MQTWSAFEPVHAWGDRKIVEDYATRQYISPAEVRVLAECSSRLIDGRALDIGVGAGRTVPYVAPAAARYVAIDLMDEMVSAAIRNHRGYDIRQADVRALPFSEGEFSFALFSFNGIDYIDPDERPKALTEIARVLEPGGYFAFSTHNIRSRHGKKSSVKPPIPELSVNPVRTGVRLARAAADTVTSVRNYLKLRDRERYDDDIAFLNDGAHAYSLLTCYISPVAQARALEAAGFEVRKVIDQDGFLTSFESDDPYLYFIAEKM